MSLLPFNKFVIHTKKSVLEVKEILANHIDEKRMFNVLRSNKKFQGNISDEGFRVTRIISYRNSFLPTLNGSFQENAEGTDLVIKLEISNFVIAFMVVLLFFFGLQTSLSFSKGNGIFFEIIFLIAFFGIVPILTFKLEAKRAKEILTDILN